MKLLRLSTPAILLATQLLNASVPQQSCVADAGANKILNVTASNRSVLLNGTNSAVTPGAGQIISYKWYEGSTYLGEGATRWYTPALGFQQIKLVIETDANSCTDEDIIAITATTALYANAGQDRTVTLTPTNPSITLNGSASRPGISSGGGQIASYAWFDANNTLLGTEETLVITPTTSGIHIIKLVVTDTQGNTASDSVIINTTVLTSAPETTIKSNAGTDMTLTVTPSNRSVHLNGTNSFSVNGIVSYAWYDNNVYIGPNSSRWYTPVGAGSHDIKLVVIDTQGNTDESHMTLTVIE